MVQQVRFLQLYPFYPAVHKLANISNKRVSANRIMRSSARRKLRTTLQESIREGVQGSGGGQHSPPPPSVAAEEVHPATMAMQGSGDAASGVGSVGVGSAPASSSSGPPLSPQHRGAQTKTAGVVPPGVNIRPADAFALGVSLATAKTAFSLEELHDLILRRHD